MIIRKEIHKEIIEKTPSVPPESGGIIGGKNGIVECYQFDLHNKIQDKAVYLPDIDFLNSIIEKWNKENIDFLGIFHSHPDNNYTLSEFDKTQITKIMESLSDCVKMLYFPIIIPEKSMNCYCAKFTCERKVIIASDELILI